MKAKNKRYRRVHESDRSRRNQRLLNLLEVQRMGAFNRLEGRERMRSPQSWKKQAEDTFKDSPSKLAPSSKITGETPGKPGVVRHKVLKAGDTSYTGRISRYLQKNPNAAKYGKVAAGVAGAGLMAYGVHKMFASRKKSESRPRIASMNESTATAFNRLCE